MGIKDKLKDGGPSFSFEFFPPKSAKGAEKLMKKVLDLERLEPNFVSVTMGAGGSSCERTKELVQRVHTESDLVTMPHLVCTGSSRDQLKQDILNYKDIGISNVLALRGDPPQNNPEFVQPENGFAYANELVEMIAEIGGFEIGVAGYPEGHPETPGRLQDLYNLKRKVDAGADFVITQLFFDNREFFDFRDQCELLGINVPIIAGIMPILTRKGVLKMCDLCGSRIPAPLLRRIFEASDEDIRKIGIEWAINQSQELLKEDVGGLHFYTLNKSTATCQISRSLTGKCCECGRCKC